MIQKKKKKKRKRRSGKDTEEVDHTEKRGVHFE